MALEELIAVLRREAESEVAAIQAAARAEAEAVQDRTATEAAARRARVAAVREHDREAAVEQALLPARKQARREILQARRELLERVLAAVRRHLPEALASPEYLATLPAQLVEALNCLGTRGGTLRFAPSLREAVRPVAAGHAGLKLASDRTIGSGFVVESADGVVRIDGTLEDRLERLADRMAFEVMADAEAVP
jgi:vacuolar-type H+-ATPase subunit E/Vma4